MNKSLLIQANTLVKASRPKLSTNKVCQVFQTGDLLEIGFLSKQCRNDAAGSCIMCDYGCADGIRENAVYIDEMREILTEYEGRFNCLLLCTNGSFMDEYQIPDTLFRMILEEAALNNVPQIEIETHYQSVTKEKLDIISQILPGKKVIIEMGLETVTPRYHDYVIMKHIDLEPFAKTILMVRQHDYDVDLNIMLGMPFLDVSEQFNDALKTVNWVLEHDCRPVIFPMNIKPFTLLFHMYQTGHYTAISFWLLVLLIDSIPDNRLDLLTIAWYGNREEVYEVSHERAIFPESCDSCNLKLMDFFSEFNDAVSAVERKRLLTELLQHTDCECLAAQRKQLEKPAQVSFEEAYSRYCNFLLNTLLRGGQ